MWAVLAVLGLLLALLALLANILGLDNDAGWGSSRLALLILGAAVAGGALALRGLAGQRRQKNGLVLPGWLQALLRSERAALAAALLTIAGLSAFTLWFASNGLFPRFPRIGSLYPLLGDAILHGQAALLEIPDPALARLDNPYDLRQREGLAYLWDASYFDGKYYLYWGPVPALVFSAAGWITPGQPPDQLVVLLAGLGLMGVLLSLLWKIRRRWYPRAPGLSLGLFIFAAVMNLPVLFLLVRPHQYETSILSGLFFLFLGLLGLWNWMDSRRPGWLALAGTGWGLAVASRYNLALSVGVFTAAALLLAWRARRAGRPFGRSALALAAPLALCALGLGLYNLARFGSPLQTGLAYQLTVAVPEAGYFSSGYFLPNLYRYMFYPYRPSGVFPVIEAVPPQTLSLPGWAAGLPALPYDQAVFGILPALPVLWLLLLWAARPAREEPGQPPCQDRGQARLLAAILGAGGLLQFLFLSFYYYYAVRFWTDFSLLLLVVVVLAAWELDRRLENAPALRVLLWGLVALACTWTAFLGFFGAFAAPPEMFEVYNPAAAAAIADRWNGLYQHPGIPGAAVRWLVRLATLNLGP
jgi:hypothetical protein